MPDNNEVWLVFRGKLVSDPSIAAASFESLESLENLDEVVEVVKAEKISKSYIKLKENPLFHPNISYGDIMQVKPCDKSLSNKVTILEFSGVEHSTEDSVDDAAEPVNDEDVTNFGTGELGLSHNLINLMKSYDSKIRPVVNDKFEQGLVFEPTKMVSHGSYKINISYEADGEDFNKMKDHFKKWNVHFQKSSAMNLGSVAFGLDTKFKKAVECLESAPWVKACYLAFSPSEFPQIEFSPDLIPNNNESEDSNE